MAGDSGAQLWDREAPTFDAEVDHGLTTSEARRAWRNLLATVLPAAPAKVADLGCGTGTLTALLAEDGYVVDGIDFSAAMVERAASKTADLPGVTVALGDAADPALTAGAYDAVLCRHVLWALPDPVAALRRWRALLGPEGVLVLIEGSWSTGAGLAADQTASMVQRVFGHLAEVRHLTDPDLWGRRINDERYLLATSKTEDPRA